MIKIIFIYKILYNLVFIRVRIIIILTTRIQNDIYKLNKLYNYEEIKKN